MGCCAIGFGGISKGRKDMGKDEKKNGKNTKILTLIVKRHYQRERRELARELWKIRRWMRDAGISL